MKEEQISDILYNALANMKEYMPVGHVNRNFTAIPNVRIASLAKQLHKLFIEEQIRMLEQLLNGKVQVKEGDEDYWFFAIGESDIKTLISQLKDQLK